MISVLVSILLSIQIVKPLTLLTESVKCSKEMEFNELPIQSKYAEIKFLVLAYNEMTSRIKKYTIGLEEMVKSRTSELDELNKKLDKHNYHLNSLNKELYNMATTDTLTGLLNRSSLMDGISNAKKEVDQQINSCFSLLFIDLDNFKYYNDTFGHEIGDLLLVEFSRLLRSIFRESDFIGRYGGDEFIILLQETNAQKANMIIDKTEAKVLELEGFKAVISEELNRTVHISRSKWLTLSIGYVTYDSLRSRNVEDLIKEADIKMYEAKKAKKQV